uniref:Uncharacterized protein n=1 Tax=Salix viminalis TaxID=40686 RepID=A0A6N2KH44_SALVM
MLGRAYKAMQRSRLGTSSSGPEEIEDGMVDGSFHSPEWHAARLASLNKSHTVTWEEFKKKQKHLRRRSDDSSSSSSSSDSSSSEDERELKRSKSRSRKTKRSASQEPNTPVVMMKRLTKLA